MWRRAFACSTTINQEFGMRQWSTQRTSENTRKRKRNFTTNRRTMDRNWIRKCSQKETEYSLVSYNILSQELLMEHSALYANIPLHFLHWEQRLLRLTNEICRLQPDILCLQEMQYLHLPQLLQKIRQNRQLEYIYKKKTNNRSDGCAIIYDKAKFSLIEEMPVEYNTDANNTFNRGNVAIFAKFSVRAEPTKHFVVATTHLLFNPKRENIRLQQAQQLLQTLQNFAKEDNSNLPIILTGDFNSVENGEVSQLIVQPTEHFRMQLLDCGPNAVSTWHDNWVKVDHIFHTQNSECCKHALCICSILQLPSFEQCKRIWKLPNAQNGSDHFALAMRFTIS